MGKYGMKVNNFDVDVVIERIGELREKRRHRKEDEMTVEVPLFDKYYMAWHLGNVLDIKYLAVGNFGSIHIATINCYHFPINYRALAYAIIGIIEGYELEKGCLED